MDAHGTDSALQILQPRTPQPALAPHACCDVGKQRAGGLRRELMGLADTLLAAARRLMELRTELLDEPESAAAATGPRPPRGRRFKTYDFGGNQLTLAELAAAAGCTCAAMQWRLRFKSPDEAVAMGARAVRVAAPAPPPRAAVSHAKPARTYSPRTYLYQGQDLTVQQLATIAGCSLMAMYGRLLTRTPDAAVVMGGTQSNRDRAAARRRGTAPAAAAPDNPPAPPPASSDANVDLGETPAPGKRETPRDHQPAPAPAPEARPYRTTAPAPVPSPAAFKRNQEVIVPPDVKRTVAVTPKDRFAVDGPPPSTFGRIGQYAETNSALARAYRGKP